MTNTLRELELIKRTAWANERRPRRGATEEEADRAKRNVIIGDGDNR